VFKKILIANRGEIACRVARTCRELGILTVAVYSDADAGAAHVAACDQAVYIGASAPKESYLNQQILLEAAKATGAEAVHPGYGFLSENAGFAHACAQAGLVFIGAPAESIRAMGSKSAAKTLMMSAAVPLVPGYHGESQDPAFLKAEADRIGYPVIIKATAGGGGKGMRVVQDAQAFLGALESCQRESKASFGDDRVLVERYVSYPRHIEVQVFADKHGNCVYLFDRDCSVQRRHQKVLEEAPAPAVSSPMRQAMGQAAVDAALAVNYEGAGTVEFIVESDERGNAQAFFFMEMNTRLQVEHPVTEMITGEDLVAWQIRVAAGHPLPKLQEELSVRGHAIEARVYAENPDNQFLPSIGTLHALHFPLADGERLRIDAGVRPGDAISPFYDPMIAKVIAWGEDRAQALARLARALEQTYVVGVKTNVQFLSRILACEAFVEPNLNTGLIEQNKDELFATSPEAPTKVYAALVANQLTQERLWLQSIAREKDSPWLQTDSWSMQGHLPRTLTFRVSDGDPVTVIVDPTSSSLRLGSETVVWSWSMSGAGVDLRLDGHRGQASVYPDPHDASRCAVFVDGRSYDCVYVNPLEVSVGQDSDPGALSAPMPGKVISILVKPGQSVQRNTPLLVMEAMKMEHTVMAPIDGVIDVIRFEVGEQVVEGAELLTFVVQAQP